MQIRLLKTRVLPVYLGQKLGLVSDVIFRDRWIVGMARIMKGWSQEQARVVFDWVVNEMAGQLREDVLTRLGEHKQKGDQVVLVSGMFDAWGQAFARRVGAYGVLGSKLAYENGVCTGKLVGKAVVGPRKLDAIHGYLAANGFSSDLSSCYGYADSFSDVSLLEAVGHGVATYPDEELRVVAEKRGWEILP